MSDNKSAAALEREAEAVRSQVANTAESLRDKMNPGEIFDEFRGYFANSDGSMALHNLKTQVRDNPLPLALIGAGLAWLFLGGGPSADRLRRSRNYSRSGYLDQGDYDDDYLDSHYTDEDWDGSGMDALGGLEPTTGSAATHRTGDVRSGKSKTGSMASKASSMAAGVSDKASSMASGMSDRASGMAHSVSDAAGSAYSKVGSAASTVTGTASSAAHAASVAARRAAKTGRMLTRGSSRMGRRMHEGYQDILAREPLVLGALGLAVGAAVGAMLPRTHYEDENIGPYRDRLRDEAAKRMHEGVEDAKEAARDVAESTYRAAKGEADRQGLTPESERSVTERVSKVAGAAAATAEKQVRDKVERSGKSQS